MTAELPEQGNIDLSVTFFETFGFDLSCDILDVGTRFGSFLQRLNALGYKAIKGIDTDPGVLAHGRERYPDLASNLVSYEGQCFPFDSGTFDVVTAFDVIEHVPHLRKFLAETRRVLRPGGTFIFQTPNLLINVPKEIIYTGSWTGWRRYHCSLQTLGSLRTLLSAAGFVATVVEKRPICSDFNIAQSRDHLGQLGPKVLRLLQTFPLWLYPNFWGHAHNPQREF